MYTICQRHHSPNSMIQLFKIYRLKSIFCLEKTETNKTHLTENIYKFLMNHRKIKIHTLQLSILFLYFYLFFNYYYHFYRVLFSPIQSLYILYPDWEVIFMTFFISREDLSHAMKTTAPIYARFGTCLYHRIEL